MRQVCASHIPRSSSGSSWNTAKIPPDSIWSKGMRQGYALGTRPHWPSQTVSRKNRICARYAPATLLARHLDPTGTRPVSCWNQSGARVCVRGVRWASHALSVAKMPLDKNRYALSMRWPHSSLGKGIHAEHGLDSAKTLVSLRYLCAGGMRPIYIYAG